MIIGQILGSIFSLFPISFFAFLMSERILATHQSRVGMGQTGFHFFKQGGVNLLDLLGKPASFTSVLVAATQFLFLMLIPFFNAEPESYPLQGGVIICLLVNLMILMVQKFEGVLLRIQNNRRMLMVALGSVLAMISAFSLFAIAGSWSVSDIIIRQESSPLSWGVFWSPVHFVFFFLFQTAGMMLFEEHPFAAPLVDEGKDYSLISSAWISSSRFYVWSILSSVLFLGGATTLGAPGTVLAFLGMQAKALTVYLFFRLIGFYFPRHAQSELLRVSLLFLIPISLMLLMFVFMLRGILNA